VKIQAEKDLPQSTLGAAKVVRKGKAYMDMQTMLMMLVKEVQRLQTVISSLKNE